jgi:hypothetical protein
MSLCLKTSGIVHSSFLWERHESGNVSMVRCAGRILTICVTVKLKDFGR